MFTRRTATVTISAPEAAWACCMTAGDEYLPVPTMRRDANDLPAIVKASIQASGSGLQASGAFGFRPSVPAAYEVHDLDCVAVPHLDGVERGPLQDDQVVLDRDAPRVDFQLSEQRGNSQRPGNLIRVAVQKNRHVPQSYRNRRRRAAVGYLASRSNSTKLPTGRSACILTGKRRASLDIQTAMLSPTGCPCASTMRTPSFQVGMSPSGTRIRSLFDACIDTLYSDPSSMMGYDSFVPAEILLARTAYNADSPSWT